MGDAAKEHILASITHPYFKMHWVPDDKKEHCRQVLLKSAQQFAAKEVEIPCSATSTNSQYNEFFSFTTEATTKNEETDINLSQLQCLQ